MMTAGFRTLSRLISRADADDFFAFREEKTRRLERLFDDAAAVVTHVENEPLRAVFHERFHRGFDLFRGILVERLQWDVADVVAEHSAVRDGGQMHDATCELQLDRLGYS